MASWQVQNAKAHFCKLLDEAESSGPQIITRHGAERAVVLSIAEFRALGGETPTNVDKPTYKDLKDWLLNGPKLDDDDPFFEALKRDPNDTGRDFELE